MRVHGRLLSVRDSLRRSLCDSAGADRSLTRKALVLLLAPDSDSVLSCREIVMPCNVCLLS